MSAAATSQAPAELRRHGLGRAAALARCAAPWLLAATLWTVVFARSLTYLTSQDPALYVHLARTLMRSPGGSPEWWQAVISITPLHTLLLAGVIKAFGLFAPYWMNFVLGLVWLALLGLAARRLGAGGWREALVLLVPLALIVRGYALNASFLLLPFREMPSLALAFASLAVFLAWRESGGPCRLAASGLLCLLAAAAREPTALIAAGPVACLLLDRRRGVRARAGQAVLFLAPLLLAATAWLTVILATGHGMSGQMYGWFKDVFDPQAGAAPRPWLGNLARYGRFLVDEAGWLGAGLLLLGAVRHRAAGGLLLLPAALIVGFYASYEAHLRYFLAPLLLAAPVMALGLADTVAFAAAALRRMRSPLRRGWGCGAEGAIAAASVAALAAAVLVPALRMQPWGPRVSRAEVRALRAALAPASDSGNCLYVQTGCRDLRAFLLEYADARVGDAEDPQVYLLAGRPVYYARPLNEACFYQGRLQLRGTSMEERLLQHGALRPAAAGGGELRLARGRYELLRLEPFAARLVREAVSAADAAQGVLWLDLRGAAGEAAKQAELRAADGTVVHAWPSFAGNGWLPLLVPPGAVPPAGAELCVASPAALPEALLARPPADGGVCRFALDSARRVSTAQWLEAPFVAGDADDKYAAALVAGGRLRLPLPPAWAGGRVEMALTLSPPARCRGEARLLFSSGGSSLGEDAIDLRRPVSTVRWTVPAPPGAANAVTDIAVIAPGGAAVPLRTVGIALRLCQGAPRP